MNVANLLQGFVTDETDIIKIQSNYSKYGDPSIAEMDIFHKFMTIDEGTTTKEFVNAKGTGSLATVKEFEWKKDKYDNVFISVTEPGSRTGTEVTAMELYDENGNALPLTPAEAKDLFAKGYAQYSYMDLNGVTGETMPTYNGSGAKLLGAKILAVKSIDYNKIGVPQTVTVITKPIDAYRLTSVLDGLKALLPFEINLPGAVFEYTITLTNTETVTFTQDGISNPIDTEIEYGYDNQTVNPTFNVTAVYTDGTVKTKQILPENSKYYFANNKFRSFEDVELVYNAYGATHKVNVKAVPNALISGDTETMEVNLGDKTLISKTVSVNYNNGETEKTANITSASAADMRILKADSTISISANVTPSQAPGLMPDTFNGYDFTFNKIGTFDVIIDYGYVQKTITFKVTDPNPRIPGYTMEAKYIDIELANPDTETPDAPATISAQFMEIKFGRTDQYGKDMSADISITLIVNDAPLEINAEEFEVYTLDKDGNLILLEEFVLKSNQVISQVIYIKILNTDYISAKADITITSPNYNNSTICSATI